MARTEIARVFLGILALTGYASAQPITIEQVVNSYSFVDRGLPNYGIAQGSIFTMVGSNLAASTAVQGVPLQTSLAGVTVNVTVGSVTTYAIPYFVSPGEITAILPSKTPTGSATITVTSGGRTGSAQTQVVRSAFGLWALLQPGGRAVVKDNDEGGKLLSLVNAANPGEHLTLWGSGLGPVPGDETQYQTRANLANVPVEVDIGGVSARVTYRGRSLYPGMDQIDVVVPAGVSGCNVSLVVTAGGGGGRLPGNFATIPLAASGRICSDPGLAPIAISQLQRLLSLANVNLGIVSLTRLTEDRPKGAAPTVSAFAAFQKYTAWQFASADLLQQPSIGICLVIDAAGTPLTPGGWYEFAPLNAGPRIDVGGPHLSLPLDGGPNGGDYRTARASAQLPVIPSSRGPSSRGAFTFTNGSGGPDVGAFTARLSESPKSAPLVWTNSSAITALHRAGGQLFTWTGGLPGSYVSIFGYSSIHKMGHLPNGYDLSVDFTCIAPVSAGQFTVPAAVLSSLPPSMSGHLFLVNAVFQQFSAPGLDLGLLFSGSGSRISVPFN